MEAGKDYLKIGEPSPPLPKGWKEHPAPFVPEGLENCQRVWSRNDGLTVMVDCVKKEDGKFWAHVSFSRPDRMPSYFDMADVKRLFIGENLKAIMVLPPSSHHVNIHSFCLHLWHCTSEDGLPEFSSTLPNGARTI